MTLREMGMEKVGKRRETETGWSGEQWWLLNLYIEEAQRRGKEVG